MRICAKRLLIGLGCLLAEGASGVTIESYGPFDVYYYETGEVINGLTNQQSWTSEQRTDVAAAIDTWDQAITSTAGRQIKMHVIWEDLPAHVLGGSSSTMVMDGSQRWQSSEFIWREGEDPGDYGIDIEVDTLICYDMDGAGVGWNFGSEAPGDFIDFRSVITHEIGHSLGISSSYDAENNVFGRIGGLTSWDMNLVDSMGNVPVLPTLETPSLFNASDNSVFFSGYNATNLYGGLVPIYAPDPYAPGSSLSHLDEDLFPDTLMTPFISAGETVRSPGALELAMMTDMGWEVIPEPTTVILVVLFASGTFAIRRIFSI